MSFNLPDKYRVTRGRMGSNSSIGNNGAFTIRSLKLQKVAFVVASDGLGWEHVSVSIIGAKRCPTWSEMCIIKGMFLGADDQVLQYHPPEADYVNTHPYTLHLWRPIGITVPAPPPVLVG